MSARYAFAAGADPGLTTGIAVLNLADLSRSRVFQCNAEAAPWLLGAILLTYAGDGMRGRIEPFVRGRGPGARMTAGRQTADQVLALAAVFEARGVPVAMNNAGTVKPWAERNDWKRLRAAGLYDLACGMPHALSALGQALYCAVLDCGMRDPLSRAERSG